MRVVRPTALAPLLLIAVGCTSDDSPLDHARNAATSASSGERSFGDRIETQIWGGTSDPILVQVVAMGLRNGNGSLTTCCSGVAVEHDRVLTAAHCFDACPLAELWVSDALDVSRPATPMRRASNVIRHQGFARLTSPSSLLPDKVFANDLAIVEVPGGQFTPWPPTRIAAPSGPVTTRKVGYGWTASASGASARRGARLSATGSTTLTQDRENLAFVFASDRATCKVDSGGATFSIGEDGAALELVGITSSLVEPSVKPGGVSCSKRALDIAVLAHQEWIELTLER